MYIFCMYLQGISRHSMMMLRVNKHSKTYEKEIHNLEVINVNNFIQSQSKPYATMRAGTAKTVVPIVHRQCRYLNKLDPR